MKIKLLIILFLGFLSTFAGEIKAEEICYYSNPDQYRDCNRKSGVKIYPKYPLTTWSGPSDLKIRNFPFYGWNIGNIYKTIEFESKTANDIKITLRDERYGVFGLKRISQKEIFINSSDIISWNSKWDNYSGTGMFDLSYVDNYGEVKEIKFQKLFKRRFADMQESYFKELTKLSAGDEKSIRSIVDSKLKRNEKNLVILKRILLNSEANTDNCLNLNEIKFPVLTKEFKQLSKTINPLREKADLPPTDEFNNICGDIAGVRPPWMEEKIKGCDKYPTKKQRDYCINVYSPYGKE